jgi:GDPmannose 4,6-dehydratase
VKKAIIVGCNGQDGKLLYDFLIGKKYSIFGIDKTAIRSTNAKWRKKIDILDPRQVLDLVDLIKPDEIYYLAAFHHSSQDSILDENIEVLRKSYEVHVHGLVNFLEAIRKCSQRSRLFYAASSLIFGAPDGAKQNENTPISPKCFYGITKAAGLFVCRYFRERYKLFASVGILYNHESKYREPNFVSKKIINGAIAVRSGRANELILGDLQAERDWGYGPDYIRAFHAILRTSEPGDFIVATGEKHSVREFVSIAFSFLGLDWRKYVREDKNIVKRSRQSMAGDAGKLRITTGWKPKVGFKEMIRQLLLEEGARIGG